jgi:hypothetical protein
MENLYKKYRLFSDFNNCDFKLLINENSYGNMIKLLLNVTLLKSFNSYLTNLLENYSKYTFENKKLLKNIDYKFTKKLLTVFLIVKFPKIVFTNKTEYNTKLIESSKKIYDLIVSIVRTESNTLLKMIQLIKHINKYMFDYNLWGMLDKRINTYVLLNIYHSNLINKKELPKDVDEYDVLMASIDNDQKEIIKSVEYMKDENEIKFFNHYKNDISYSKTIEEKIFLIELKYKLTKNPPDKMVFVELVEKTKECLKRCVPNRKDHHENIDNILDTELMTTYINNDIIDNNYFFNIIQIIIDKVKEYQATADDIELEEFRHKCTSSLRSNEFYNNFIPMFFIEVLKRLDKIIVERETFIKLLNKN